MKTISKISSRILFLFLFFCCSLISCQKLDEKPVNFISPETFYNSVSQCETALASSMSRLWSEWADASYSYGMQYFVNDDQLLGGDLNISPSNGDKLWNSHYASLLNVNAVLKAIRSGKVGGSQEDLDKLQGQAKFIRGYNYFMLVRMFGDVPLYTDENEDPAVNPLPRSSVQEVYNLIISDFQDAGTKLPSSWPAGMKGRMTSAAAKGLLAKAYLTMATFPLNASDNYAKAAAAAKSAMDEGIYSLTRNVYEVFLQSNKYGPEMMWSFNANGEDFTTSAQIWAPQPLGGWGDYQVDPAFERAWPNQPRKEAYLVTEVNGVKYQDYAYNQSPACRKYIMPNISQEEFDAYRTKSNMPIIRYADVLLIYAEAANMANSSPTQEACNAINQVIERANGYTINPEHPLLTTAMSKDDFDKAVLRERSWELCFEYDRWFDIIRKRTLKEVTPLYQQNFSDDDYLFAIPSIDLGLNKLLTQNPGYPSN